MSSLETLQNPSVQPSSKKVLELSREALAEKLGISVEKIPSDREVIKLFDKQLDDLASTINKIDPKEQAKVLKERLSFIQSVELADRAKEFVDKGKDMLASETLEQTGKAINAATDKLKDEGLNVGQDAMKAVGAIATAGSVADATKGIDLLSSAIDAGGKLVTNAMGAIKDIFSSLFKMLGLDKLFKSIGGLFGMKFDEKEENQKQKDATPEIFTKAKAGLNKFSDKEEKEKLLKEYSGEIGDMISRQYFGGDKKLSPEQLKKIQSILEKHLPLETLQKIQERYDKDGNIQVGEIANASLNLMATFPASMILELAFSGIIPYWAIVSKFAIEPGKALINLTIDGLPWVDVPVSMDVFGSFIDEKMKSGDSHSLDIARVQLYGASGLIWKFLGSMTAGAASLGIMFTDTTTGVDGKKMFSASLMKEYDSVANMFSQIEKKLGGTGMKSDILAQYMGAISEVQTNARIMQIVADNSDDKVKMVAELQKRAKEFKITNYINDLSKNIHTDSPFRDTLKKMLVGRESSIASWGEGFERIAKEYLGGLDGATLKNLQKLDAIKARQVELIGSKGLKATLDNMKLAFQSLTVARSADTMIIHLEDAKDVSKFRAFLATIPGGIRGLAEVLPAAGVIFSLGRIGIEGLKKEPGIQGEKGESFLDVLAYTLVPLYGTGSFLYSQTVPLREFIVNGKIPPITDLAITTTMGGVALIEAKRVLTAGSNIYHGEYVKGLKKLTYIDDLVHSTATLVRGTRNIVALATNPATNPEFSKMLARVAEKMPHKGRFAIGTAALLAAGGAYAYFSGPETPEDIKKNLTKDGWIDARGGMTEKLREQFYLKNTEQRKEILDNMLILALGKNKELPKTFYDASTGKYSLVGNIEGLKSLIDSDLRNNLQSLGLDIDFMKDA